MGEGRQGKMGHDGTDGMGQDRRDGMGWEGMGWDGMEQTGWGRMGQDRQERTDRTLPSDHCGEPCGRPGGTAHSRCGGRALLTRQSPAAKSHKAAQIQFGECQDSAGSRGQAENDDGVASGGPQAHTRAHGRARTFPSILQRAVISSLFCFGNHS